MILNEFLSGFSFSIGAVVGAFMGGGIVIALVIAINWVAEKISE